MSKVTTTKTTVSSSNNGRPKVTTTTTTTTKSSSSSSSDPQINNLANNLMKSGLNTQASSKAHLSNILRVIQDTKPVGVTINSNLSAQTQQLLNSIDKNMNETDSSLRRSNKVITRMERRT